MLSADAAAAGKRREEEQRFSFSRSTLETRTPMRRSLSAPVAATPAVVTPAVVTPAVVTPAAAIPTVPTPPAATPAVVAPAAKSPAAPTPPTATPAAAIPAVPTPPAATSCSRRRSGAARARRSAAVEMGRAPLTSRVSTSKRSVLSLSVSVRPLSLRLAIAAARESQIRERILCCSA